MPVILTITIANCSYSPNLDERYFPLPDKKLSIIRSQAQTFMVDTVVSDLNRPWSMEFLPDSSVLITEREGNLLVVRDGIVQKQPIGGNVPVELRDIKLHPHFNDNGWIYISFYITRTEDEGAFTVLMRGQLKNHKLVNDEILFKAGPFSDGANWFGSRIAFDNDGYLYMTIGQRHTWPREPRSGPHSESWYHSQDLSNYQGSTVRLFDDGRIPPDNPFVDSVGALPEIYSYGHRQHQGLVRHPITGALWSTEHGEFGGDELNIIRPGCNYGWPLASYSLNYDRSYITRDTLLNGMTPPEHHWTPAIAPSGLDFVYSDLYPGWYGDLLVASLNQRMVNRSVMNDNKVISDEKLLEGIGRVRTIKVAPDGFIYIMTEDTGLIVRLIPTR